MGAAAARPPGARPAGAAGRTGATSAGRLGVRVGPLSRRHRARVEAITRETAVFSDDETAVAVELFDEVFSSPAPSSSYVFLGAFTPEDELVGYACYGPTPGTDRTWDLYWIAVHPSAQGTGSGTTLLSEVERRLRDINARLLVVETSSRPDYSATLAFYRARGYTEAARVESFYAPADSRVILIKRFREHSLPDITGGELGHHE